MLYYTMSEWRNVRRGGRRAAVKLRTVFWEVTGVFKRLLFAALCALMPLLLAGCGGRFAFQAVEELYALPRASEEYASLQGQLQELLDGGLEYAPPLSGSNTQAVRLQDLDGDGENEALAFFRESGAKELPLKIYIFRKNSEDVYETACVIAGDGVDINSVQCCQMVGGEDSICEMAVSWQVSSTLYTLSAYSLADYQPAELMTPTSYTRYSIRDMDQDGEVELILLSVDNSDSSASCATYYDNIDGMMAAASTANLSMRMSSIDKTRNGILADGTPVLYVTGSALDVNLSSPYQITDILAIRGDALCNITLNAHTLSSDTTIRANLTGGQDINGDGVLEIPAPFTLPCHDSGTSDTFYAIDWQQYALDGSYTVAATTYYNSTDGWYLELPEEWLGRISLARQDVMLGSTNERAVYFYRETEESRADTPAFAVYKNTGTNREQRSAAYGRTILSRDNAAIYSMELFDGAELEEEELTLRFHLITTDWSMD